MEEGWFHGSIGRLDLAALSARIAGTSVDGDREDDEGYFLQQWYWFSDERLEAD